MNAIGYFLILIALVLARGMSRGRMIGDEFGDLSDAFKAAISGDFTTLRTVFSRVGNPTDVSTNNSAATSSGNLLSAMHQLGDGKTYALGASGPNSYDCSGLVWKALGAIGAYKGLRFTSLSFPAQCSSFATVTTSPQVGDIVRWYDYLRATGHLGVVDGPDSVFSALSPASGIKSMSISGLTAAKGAPTYYRLK